MSTFTFDGPLGLGADAVLKGTLFLALLFLASPALHRLSAGARHLVWGSGLLLLVVIPGLSRVMPWRIEVLPSITSAPVAEQVTPKFDAPSPTPTPTPTPPKHAAPSGTDRLPQAGVVTSAPLSGGSFWHTVDLGVLALWLWVGGLALALLRLVAGQFSAARLVREARPVDESAWATARARAAAHHGLLHPPTLLLSDELPLPVTTGIRHPVILLPEGADAWPEARRESVLLHEMAHVRRRDLITQLFARIVCAAWWFHPLAWRALTRFRLESERAADDLVLAAGRRASEYAQDLLAVVQDAGRSRAPMHALAMAQRSDFEGRLLAILEPGASRRGVTPMTAIPLVLIVSLAALPLAAIGPVRVVGSQEASPPSSVVAPEAKPAPAGAPVLSELERLPALARRSAPVVSKSTAGAARALVIALEDPVPEVRLAAARSLGHLGDTTVIAALTHALANDTDAGVRRAAAWALGQLEQSSAVPALSTALRRDQDLEVRRTSAWALGQIEDAAAVDALGAVLNDPDTELRRKAVWALGQIQSARAVPMLLPVLRDVDPEARSQAAWALGQIESKDATEALGRAAGDSSRAVRSQVAWALGQIEDPASVPALARLLRDPVADVRKQAAWALGQIQDPAAASALETALRDAEVEVRKNAAWALGQLDLRRVPPGLIAAFDDAEMEVRKNAAWAAGQIEDPAAIVGLTKLLSDPEREVQKNALWALGQIDDPRALEGVTRLLRSNDAVLRRMAAEALGRDH